LDRIVAQAYIPHFGRGSGAGIVRATKIDFADRGCVRGNGSILDGQHNALA
jgi:hypothetical protein